MYLTFVIFHLQPTIKSLKTDPASNHSCYFHICYPGPGHHHLCPRSLPWRPHWSLCLCPDALHLPVTTAVRGIRLTHMPDNPPSAQNLWQCSRHLESSQSGSWPEKPQTICLPVLCYMSRLILFYSFPRSLGAAPRCLSALEQSEPSSGPSSRCSLSIALSRKPSQTHLPKTVPTGPSRCDPTPFLT